MKDLHLKTVFTYLLTYVSVDCLYRKKIEEIGEKTSSPAMTQEEIISSTKTVVQGLETLRVEHHQVLNGLQAAGGVNNEMTDATTVNTSGLTEEKTSLLKKSIEMIELAMGEAQVSRWFSRR